MEEVAEKDFGLTGDIICENAGRGIAEVLIRVITDASSSSEARRLAAGNQVRAASTAVLVVKPVVVILVGDHRSGARALAAGRHLLQRDTYRVIACPLASGQGHHDFLNSQPAHESIFDDRDASRQLRLFILAGGQVVTWIELQVLLHRHDTHSPSSASPLPSSPLTQQSMRRPDLIMEGLVAPGKRVDQLAPTAKAVAQEMISWANECSNGGGNVNGHADGFRHGYGHAPPIPIVSIDCPSGLDALTG